MGLQLNVSDSLKDLVEQLAVSLREQPGDVFQKQYLVTQTEGMNNWLTIQLAGKLGINANCKFLKPNDIVSQLYYWLGGDSNEVLGVDHLQWLIYNLLGEPEFTQRYKTIAGYYLANDIKRIALAGKVADLFDQYQVYRPEMIGVWNTATMDTVANSDWQKYIWIKVKEKTGDRLTDKTSVIQFIIRQLNDPAWQERLFARLPHIHIFGVSIITQFHIHLFSELSKYISVNFYLLNPAPMVYWLEDKTEKQIARMGRMRRKLNKPVQQIESSGNNLLVSWGKVIQETFSLLFEHEDFLNVYNDTGVTEPEIGEPDTLLKKIQRDIFYNSDGGSRNPLTLGDIRDGSLTLNSCYTPVREVEVLYNYLVHLVDQKKERLSPRDIVVMVSDIDTYAPYIKAVFNTSVYKFPYTIADESLQTGDSLFTALQAILSISADSFKAEEVMQLLDSKYTRERFNISDTAMVRRVVGMANIRFGIEGNQEDDTVLVSWDTGIKRIMYGICMSGCEEYTIDGDTIYPLDVTEGANALELVRFGHFIEVLKWYVTTRSNSRTLAGWGQYIQQLVDNLIFQPDANEADEDYLKVLEYIENLNLLTETYNEAISYDVFKHSFLDVFTAQTRSGSFAVGGITFCSLIPMRSIPFKVVALLGMNFDKFPRKEIPLSFNLMEQKRRKGDRNVKENDKHLFLETILSARQYLYISYIGRNAKDNSVHPPSALVDELVDYVESGVAGTGIKTRDELITNQPLHGFSQKYFQPNGRLYSYLQEAGPLEVAVADDKNPKEDKAFEGDEIAVGSLLSFFKNPFKWYYNKILGIYYNDEDVLLPDTELFELDSLQKWKLKNDLLSLDGDAIEGYRLKELKTGNLPLKNMSTIEITDIAETVAPVKKLFDECVGDEIEQAILIEIPLEDTVITGKIKGIYSDKILVVSFSKNQNKYLLEAYLKYLLLTAQGLAVELNYLSAEENSVAVIAKNTYTQAEALQRLTELVKYFKEGHTGIFLLYPEWKENPLKMAEYDFEKFNKAICNYLDRSPNEYLQKEYENGIFSSPDAVGQFIKNTVNIFLPVAQLFPELLPLPKKFKV
ncbi:MAG: exodeoxyribonuclease V subunit gamma [Ferruginibacter sp.]